MIEVVFTKNEFIKFFIKTREFTMKIADDFKNKAYCKIDSGKNKFIVDLSDCDFIDSTALGSLVLVYKKVTENNGRFILCVKDKKILEILELTRLSEVFEIYSSYEEALDEIRP